MSRLVLCNLSMLLLLPASSPAATAITCHCFTNRSYEPSRPALADPYFLATTQNSFFAALFNADKKMIVMKKQTGSSADDLWVAYWVASRSGSTGEALLVARGKKRSWQEVIVPLGLPAKSLGERFAVEAATGASSARLAQEIVDDVLVRHRLLGEQELTALRKERASNQEVIITALITARVRRPAVQIYRDVKNGLKSWGALLGEAKIQASAIQSEFVTLLK
ncbi:MAG: hypothetical protein PVSMB11_07080 [Desulfuromonadaceae bacterium]